MARQFFACIICGKTGERDAAPDDSPTKPTVGWIAFLAVHWPAGVEPGPLVLRICGACFLAALVRGH